jgi:tetratricopeptide (TPR) repeat protein
MLDKKAVDIAYLDRKIAALKVLALLQEEDYRIPYEIGRCYLEKGTALALAHRATVNLYAALDYLSRAAAFSVPDTGLMLARAETCYLLGRYDEAGTLWSAMLDGDQGADPRIEAVLEAMGRGEVPRIAPVDYLEAAGVALDLHRQEEYEEAGAILTDILADELFAAQFPLPQLHCLLADCCRRLGWAEHARESYGQALAIDPTCREAADGLAACGGTRR